MYTGSPRQLAILDKMSLPETKPVFPGLESPRLRRMDNRATQSVATEEKEKSLPSSLSMIAAFFLFSSLAFFPAFTLLKGKESRVFLEVVILIFFPTAFPHTTFAFIFIFFSILATVHDIPINQTSPLVENVMGWVHLKFRIPRAKKNVFSLPVNI